MRHINDWSYTKLPNHIITFMPTMGHAELRVVLAVVRQTVGWHRNQDVISITQFMRLTGLSRQGVLRGIAAAIEHDMIGRRPVGNSYSYSLVQQLDQSNKETGQSFVPVSVHPVDRDMPQPVQMVDPQKKEQEKKEQEKKENDVVTALIELGLTRSQARKALVQRPGFSTADVDRCKQWLHTSTAKNAVAVLWASFLCEGDLPPQPVSGGSPTHGDDVEPLTLHDVELRAAALRDADPDLTSPLDR